MSTPKAALREADRLAAAARALLDDHAAAVDQVQRALGVCRRRLVSADLDAIPLSRLRDVTGGRLRITALEAAGMTSVRQVLDSTAYQLRTLPGVGAQTAAQTLAAADQIARAVESSVAVRIDVARPEADTTALVEALHRMVAAGPDRRRARDCAADVSRSLAALLPDARPARSRLRMLTAGRRRRETAMAAVTRIRDLLADVVERGLPLLLAQASADLLREPAGSGTDPARAWIDFEVRAADYYAVLGEIAEDGPPQAATEGHLPAGLADTVRAEALDDTLLRVSLRGYQAFGARFALARGRVMLGDEMGLGKTVQAIAVLAHLRAGGRTHFLVVCPAGVLVNWLREIEFRSTLRAFRLHGPERAAALAAWAAAGGVAVTTYDSLRRFDVPAETPVCMLVVDEAHYVKNRAAQRSQAVARWTERVERVLFLTGTPMENRVEEFAELVRYLQPGLPVQAAGPDQFRSAVAPVYLRRNQQDVLTELPEAVHVDEWVDLGPAERAAYREAVRAGSFMAMRRAAYAEPAESAKLARLVEIIEETQESGLKAVVFSGFRDVLAAVATELDRRRPGRRVFGPVAGRVSADRRQELVDEFSATPGHAVLLAQIQAGGTGLNIQAASVVVLCEPQIKPTLESQAVGRVQRMGQIRRVRVHRLLATDSVDQRLLEILDGKEQLFDAYARRSETAESAPEALDLSERSLALRIVEDEQLRLATTG